MKLKIIFGLIIIFIIGCGHKRSDGEPEKNQKTEVNKAKPIDLKNWIETPHVSGRLATEEDVKNGSATFLVDDKSEEHKALNIKIPSLAYHFDQETNEKKPVVVIQGEKVGDQKVIGIKYLDGTDGVCLLFELEFVDNFNK
ncbi:hypothetical protein [Flavobacteriaceae bacterium 14752]|uniref:hypothetical protein n=1 Tax=Mesohalobacter salilacus TaxID=2491711 RepID=UPI000F63A817|nr:hypothetical protein EIG84_00655 [Flavobacteriaceae bacterium 14752]